MTATASRTTLETPPAARSEHATLCAAFQAAAAARPDRVALRTPGDRVRLTWAQYDAAVQRAAAQLAALGVGRGDTVGLLLTTRPEASIVDAAAMHLGAAGVSLYLAAPPATHAYVLDDIAARVLVTEQALAAQVPGLLRACPALEHAVSVDGAAPAVRPLDDVEGLAGFDFAAARSAVRPGDPATIMYTSGTTGVPKGVVYTHQAILAAFAALDAALPPADDVHAVAYIPFAHAGQRAMGHYRSMLGAATTTFCADPATLPTVIRDARPSYLFGPPAVWQGVAAAAAAGADAEARAALAHSLQGVRAARRGESPAPLGPGDRALLARLRERAGLDRLAQPFISAAPPPPELLEALHALGLPLREIYALSELPPITMTDADPLDIGTVGRPLPGVQVRLADDGEVLVRHPAASSGYHARPAQTAALFDADGWAHTGDLGRFDEHGRLSLRGRRDERIITSLGHNIDPVTVETALKAETPLIAQACVMGDRRPHLVAVLTLQPGAGEHPEAIAAAVERANAKLPVPGRVMRHVVLDDTWAPGGDELTPTHKLRRHAIQARYAELIAELYRDA
jgi:long-chain acyl-CoA synthetase